MRADETGSQAQRFEALWERCGPRVMAYAMRHVDQDTAQDVVSETFLVAWRRLAQVPDDPLPWLLVVARNTISNQVRSRRRQAQVASQIERLRDVAEPAAAADVLVTDRTAVLAELAAMTPKEREALLLTAWDGLSPAHAAQVAGCTVPTFQVRLFRARRRLRQASGPEPSPQTETSARPLPSTGGTA